jgi:hypothetical protein
MLKKSIVFLWELRRISIKTVNILFRTFFFVKLDLVINNILGKVKNVFNKKDILFNLLLELNYSILNTTDLFNSKD